MTEFYESTFEEEQKPIEKQPEQAKKNNNNYMIWIGLFIFILAIALIGIFAIFFLLPEKGNIQESRTEQDIKSQFITESEKIIFQIEDEFEIYGIKVNGTLIVAEQDDKMKVMILANDLEKIDLFSLF